METSRWKARLEREPLLQFNCPAGNHSGQYPSVKKQPMVIPGLFFVHNFVRSIPVLFILCSYWAPIFKPTSHYGGKEAAKMNRMIKWSLKNGVSIILLT